MVAPGGGSASAKGLATERLLSTARGWTSLPPVIRDACQRNDIYTASGFVGLFADSEPEARELAMDLLGSEEHFLTLLSFGGR